MQQHTRHELQKAEVVGSMVMPNGIAVLKFIYTLFIIFLGWMSVTLEVFVRRDFGERYLNLVRLVFAYLTMQTFRLVYILFLTISSFSVSNSLFGGGRSSPSLGATTLLFQALSYGFLLAGAFHLWRIWNRNRKGQEWHSVSFGVSWLSVLPVSDWVLYRFVEPGVWLVIGLIVTRIDPLAGGWLLIAAGALFLKNQMVYAEERGRYLDLVDAQIEAVHMQAARQGTPKQETAGFTVVPVPVGTLFADQPLDITATVKDTLEGASPANT